MATKPYAYPSDVSDEEWTFVLPYLLLSTEDSGARRHPLRAVFDAYRSLFGAGCRLADAAGQLPDLEAGL